MTFRMRVLALSRVISMLAVALQMKWAKDWFTL